MVQVLFSLRHSQTLLFSFRVYIGFFYFQVYRLSDHVSVLLPVISFSPKSVVCLFSLTSNFASSFRVFLTIWAVRLFSTMRFCVPIVFVPFEVVLLLPMIRTKSFAYVTEYLPL